MVTGIEKNVRIRAYGEVLSVQTFAFALSVTFAVSVSTSTSTSMSFIFFLLPNDTYKTMVGCRSCTCPSILATVENLPSVENCDHDEEEDEVGVEKYVCQLWLSIPNVVGWQIQCVVLSSPHLYRNVRYTFALLLLKAHQRTC